MWHIVSILKVKINLKEALILYFKYLYLYLYFILRFGFKRGNPLKTEKCVEKNISLMVSNMSLFLPQKKVFNKG